MPDTGGKSEFGEWKDGAPVVVLGDTGDFANWKEGAPVVTAGQGSPGPVNPPQGLRRAAIAWIK